MPGGIRGRSDLVRRDRDMGLGWVGRTGSGRKKLKSDVTRRKEGRSYGVMREEESDGIRLLTRKIILGEMCGTENTDTPAP